MPRLGKPSLCAANGHVLAGGMGLALSCDLLIAKEGARFGTPEINVGAFPYMIMSIIYRNVPRKKVNEMMLLGEQISAEQAVEYGIANKVVPAGSVSRGAVSDWATKLASKSPVLMRLGHDAMYRQQDMALDDALEYPALTALAHLLDRGHPGGRQGLLREARARMEGATELSQPSPGDASTQGFTGATDQGEAPEAPDKVEGGEETGMKGLTEDVHARREKAKLGGGRGEDRAPARARQAHRARADRPALRPRHLRRDRDPRPAPLLPAEHGGQGGARRRRDHGLGRRRRPPLLHRRLRLHRDGRLDGGDRGAQGEPPARDGAHQADAVHLAARLGRGADPGGGGVAVRRAPDTSSRRRS